MSRKFLLLFVVYVVAGGFVLSLPWVESHLVDPWTRLNASGTAALARLVGVEAQSLGADVFYGRGTLRIVVGCNGVEATLVLLAAMLAFPAPWRHKVLGLVIGVIAVQLLNIVRVISLFYLGQWNYDVFEWAHLYVWQALIMLDVLVVWLIWVRRVPRIDGPAGPPGAPPALAAG